MFFRLRTFKVATCLFYLLYLKKILEKWKYEMFHKTIPIVISFRYYNSQATMLKLEKVVVDIREKKIYWPYTGLI